MRTASQIDISKALTIGGWMSEKELIWLAEHARECETIVEFGSFHGRSCRAMADNSNAIIYAVDPWNGTYKTDSGEVLEQVDTYVLPLFRKNLHEHIISGRVIPIRNFSYNFFLNKPVDMVFIDGDHRYETVLRDIDKALELTEKNSIISGHDYNHPLWTGVTKAVHEKLDDIQIEDSIWWTRRY